MFSFGMLNISIYLTGILIISTVISTQINPIMKMTVGNNQITLSCLVSNRNSNTKIFLFCPLADYCKENCKSVCSETDNTCLTAKNIECTDKGFDKNTGIYQIDYVISGTDSNNQGKWSCSYKGQSSSIAFVNTTIKNTITTAQQSVPINKPPSITEENPKNAKEMSTKVHIPYKPPDVLGTRQVNSNDGYGKILTRTEFILSVIALLAISLVLNIVFCSRLILVHLKEKKFRKNRDQDYFSMQQNHRSSSRCTSNVSDSERIYEDTSVSQRQMSFFTKIKNANGNYVASSTLSPASGVSTLLPQSYHVPLNHSISFPGSVSDNGTIMNDIYYPGPKEFPYPAYGALSIPPDNHYTNFVSVQPEVSSGNDNNGNGLPLYLAFQPMIPLTTNANIGFRHLQYGSQPLPITAIANNKQPPPPPPALSSNTLSSVPSQTGQPNPTSGQRTDRSNFQLSREMIEEADTLLRTADTLLKTTHHEVELYK